MSEQIEKFVMPTVAHTIVLHFKNLVVGKDDAKIADLMHVASVKEHVTYANTVNKSVATDTEQNCVKRNSEEYTIQIPDFGSLIADMLDGIDGLGKSECVRVQELVAKHVDDFARKLVDGAVERDEEGNVVAIEGFERITAENASFLLASLESLGRKAAGGKNATVPAAVRDAALESFSKYLQLAGVPEKGIKIMVAAMKSYFSPSTMGQLTPAALEKIKGRIESWYSDATDEEQDAYAVVNKRWVDKIDAALTPEDLDLDIL